MAERELEQVKQHLHSAYGSEGAARHEGAWTEALRPLEPLSRWYRCCQGRSGACSGNRLPRPPGRAPRRPDTPKSGLPRELELTPQFEGSDYSYRAETWHEPPFEARLSRTDQPDQDQLGLRRWFVSDTQGLVEIAEDIASRCRTGVGKVTLVVDRMRSQGRPKGRHTRVERPTRRNSSLAACRLGGDRGRERLDLRFSAL